MYINKIDNIVNKYYNTYHSTIKMKPVDLKPSIYIDFNKENDMEDPIFRVGDDVRISKYKKVFAKVEGKIGLKKFLWLENLKILFRGHIF